MKGVEWGPIIKQISNAKSDIWVYSDIASNLDGRKVMQILGDVHTILSNYYRPKDYERETNTITPT